MLPIGHAALESATTTMWQSVVMSSTPAQPLAVRRGGVLELGGTIVRHRSALRRMRHCAARVAAAPLPAPAAGEATLYRRLHATCLLVEMGGHCAKIQLPAAARVPSAALQMTGKPAVKKKRRMWSQPAD
mmetsp:Transcript_11099/g.25452  ORF Transcript_11099/g.25452 Transcript_11099/m.25452 type:complete len:130 (+) Transcript_11099:607-996(+)